MKLKICKNCKHCIFEKTQPSPSGAFTIQWYKCVNKESPEFGKKFSVLEQVGKTIDARNSTCDKFEKIQ